MKLILGSLLLFISLQISADSEDAIITLNDINKICKISGGSYRYEEGGFPFIVDKHTVNIKDKNCGIKINFIIYDFISVGLAKEKFNDLVEANKIAGIALKPVDEKNLSYIWESDNKKYAYISVKDNFVYNVVFNVDPSLFKSMKLLSQNKYNKL